MKRIVFLVQGSSEEPYELVFQNDGPDVSATCTCQAGALGQSCKHRVAVLEGSAVGIVSGNEAEIAQVVSWLPGSKLAHALQELVEAGAGLEQAKKRVAACKKQLARAMRPKNVTPPV